MAPTSAVLSLPAFQPKETIDHTNPDWTYHEVGKFLSLALKCNPTVTELLWLDGYRVLTEQGQLLVDQRRLFLSAPYVKNAYTGYCFSQASKLTTPGGAYGNGRTKRYEKQTRHLFRLLSQGRELLETGHLTVRVTPEMREELFAAGQLPPKQVLDRFREEIEQFNDITSVLPNKPDTEGVNTLLLTIRKASW